MNIDADTLSQLLSSLKDYNPTVYGLTDAIATALQPVALVILGVLMYMEFQETQKRLTPEQGRITIDVFIGVTWKYFAAFAVVMLSGQIIDSLVWLNSAIGHIIDNTITNGSKMTSNIPGDPTGSLHWWQRAPLAAFQALAGIFNWIGDITVKILIFLRFFQLFIYKAAAPVMVSTYVSEEWKSVGQSYVKQFIALIIQSFLLVLILKIYPALIKDDMFQVAASGDFMNALATYFIDIVKSVVFIFVLIGSQNQTKRWMGV